MAHTDAADVAADYDAAVKADVEVDVESVSAPDALCIKVVLVGSNMKLLFCSIAFNCPSIAFIPGMFVWAAFEKQKNKEQFVLLYVKSFVHQHDMVLQLGPQLTSETPETS